MCFLNVGKIETNLVLSIQYSRLLEEVKVTEEKLNTVKSHKMDLLKNKKIEKYEKYILDVKKYITDMETQFDINTLKLLEDNKLVETLDLLSNRNDFETIKYNIAIRTVLDNTIDYKYSGDYLKKISKTLFGDSLKIKHIYDELLRIHSILTQNKELERDFGDDLSDASNKISATPFIPHVIDLGRYVVKSVQKHPAMTIALTATGAIVAVGGGVIHSYIKNSNQVKAFKKVSLDDLEYVLLVNALCLKLASEYMDEVEYYKYFQKKMKSINELKRKLNKEVFVKWYEKNSNSKKLMMLNRFDEYLIKDTNFIKK